MNFFKRGDTQELIAMAEHLASQNGHLQIEVGRLRAELATMRKSKQLAGLRGDRRMIEKAAADARFLAALHLAGLTTGRRADTHGLSRWRHESATALLRLGGVFGRRGWKTTDPATVHQGIERGRASALAQPERWKYRLPRHRLNLGTKGGDSGRG